MKTISKFSALAAIPALIGLMFVVQGSDAGSLEGLVKDESGPVAEAVITARHFVSGQVWHAKSDKDGRYLLSKLARGEYSVWIEAAGHESAWIFQVFIERDVVTHQDFVLRKSIGRHTQSVPPAPR